ncbi:MAG: hypothetical protein ABIQ18_05500 [Umezawaea sp.]
MSKSHSATTSPVASVGPSVALDALAAELVLLRQVEAQRAKLTVLRTSLHNKFKAALGEVETGTVAGVPVVSHKLVCSISLDQSRLKREHPEVVEACLDITEARRFVLLKVAA